MAKIHPDRVEFVFRPLVTWTGPTGPARRNSPFRVTPGRTQDDLRCELAALNVARAVIQADLDESDIRIDGMPRANARFRSGRVVLSFEHPKAGPMSMPCGAFADLWDNLRAITKTLEALRAVDRYGVTQRSEQYAGWKQLPPQGGANVEYEFVTVEDAARFLIKTAAPGLQFGPETVRSAILTPGKLTEYFRAAAQRAHPDVGGSEDLMRKVNAARDMIERARKGGA